jgi:hypothetical protein
MTMKYKALQIPASGLGLTAIAMICAVPAHAQSSTEPGFTTGIPLYAPQLPEGLYIDVVPDISMRDTDPDTTLLAVAPFFVLQTGVKAADARIMLVASPVYGEVKVGKGPSVSGFYNAYVGAQATWHLGGNWGLGVRLAGWIPGGGKLASPHGTFAPRIGVTYFSPKEHFTASFERGYTFGNGHGRTAGNYVNLDLTYTRTHKKLEYGVVSYMSANTGRPFPGYARKAQIAAGPLLGTFLGNVWLQGKFTTDIAQRNYGGREKRIELNITVPLWAPKRASSPPEPN